MTRYLLLATTALFMAPPALSTAFGKDAPVFAAGGGPRRRCGQAAGRGQPRGHRRRHGGADRLPDPAAHRPEGRHGRVRADPRRSRQADPGRRRCGHGLAVDRFLLAPAEGRQAVRGLAFRDPSGRRLRHPGRAGRGRCAGRRRHPAGRLLGRLGPLGALRRLGHALGHASGLRGVRARCRQGRRSQVGRRAEEAR